MQNDIELLQMSAARLYSLGLDVEGARAELKRLVAKGASGEPEELREAYEAFKLLDEQWKELEREHIKLRDEVLLSKNSKRN